MTVNMILYNVPVNINTEKNINDRHTNNIYLWFINFDFVSFSLNSPRVVKLHSPSVGAVSNFPRVKIETKLNGKQNGFTLSIQ